MARLGLAGGVEMTERHFPVLSHSVSIYTDSGGPGRWRGGPGIVKEFAFLCDADLTVRANDRYHLPPPGLNGGGHGRPGAFLLNQGGDGERLLPGKQTNIRVCAGDTLTTKLCGAGGYGDPLERPVDLVVSDVADGWVSVEGAAHDYGVVIDPVTGELDPSETDQLRRQAQANSGGKRTSP
jgi:N-methylhydantoinase B